MKPPFARWGLRYLCLLFGCQQTGLAQTTAPPPDDEQQWNEFQLRKPLSKTKDLVLIGVLRLGRGFERFVDEQIGAAVIF